MIITNSFRHKQTQTGYASSITQFEITWTFDKEYAVGQFVNGDYWVMPDTPEGTVTITNINPLSASIEGNILHGSQVNPKSNDAAGVGQGFDARLSGYSSTANIGMPSGSTLSVANPAVLYGDSSLISTISNLVEPEWLTKDMALYTALVLTVVKSVPAADSFRPGYAGDNKAVKFNKSDIDYSVLGSMALTEPVDIAFHEPKQQRVWINHWAYIIGSYMHPSMNMPGDGAKGCEHMGIIAMLLNSSDFTDAEKETCLINLVQVGIDNYSIHDDPDFRKDTWGANGQIGPGRKFPILFAGKVLGSNALAAPMLNIGDLSIDTIGQFGDGYVSFAEDEQTFYVSAHPDSATDEQKRAIWLAETDTDYDIFVPDPDNPEQPYRLNWENNSYIGHALPSKLKEYDEYKEGIYVAGTEWDEGAGHENMPEWGIEHIGHWHSQLYWHDGLNWSASYRESNGLRWGAFVLSAHCMGLTTVWQHDSLFDYFDRYMTITSEQWTPFVEDMWLEHRSSF